MNFGNLDVHDIKSAFNKVKAAVLNLSELEQKVREATSNEAWGASSSLMNELSKATYDFQGFNEIMPAVYKRFSQEGRTWRNIYKSLTLIEYLIKNGSEKVIDYVRSHSYELKTCLNYNCIDEKGKDQGINIRHRAKLIIELLQNDELIRMERQKANENKAKYGGVGSDGSRFGGFAGGSSSGYGGSGYGGGGGNSSYNSGYPGFAGGSSQSATGFVTQSSYGGRSSYGGQSSPPPVAPAAKPVVPVSVDLLGFDDVPPPTSTRAHKPDDDWGDFASGSSPIFTQPAFASFNNTSTLAAGSNAATSAFDDHEFADFAAAPSASGSFFSSSSPVAPAVVMQSTPGHDLLGNSNMIGINSSTYQPASKITANTPLSQVMGSNLVDLDSLAMLGAKANTHSGPSMNSMIASTAMVGGGSTSPMVPMATTAQSNTMFGGGYQSPSGMTSPPAFSTAPSSNLPFQQQQQQVFGGFNSGSLL